MAIPAFTSDGVLPAGDYAISITELKASQLVVGPGSPDEYPNWDAAWRLKLVENLEVLAAQLSRIGIEDIYVNGSFVEDKDHPNDIDGYFPCELARLATGELARELNLLDPYKIWTWDPARRTPFRG